MSHTTTNYNDIECPETHILNPFGYQISFPLPSHMGVIFASFIIFLDHLTVYTKHIHNQ